MGLISFVRQASSKDGTKGKRQDLIEGCLMQDLRRDLLRSDQRKRALWEQTYGKSRWVIKPVPAVIGKFQL